MTRSHISPAKAPFLNMDKYTAGKIEGMLFASRRFIEIAAEELRVAASGVKKLELGVKMGAALASLLDVSGEIYAEHPKLNPFLEMERATAEWYAIRRKTSPKGTDPFGGMEFIAGRWQPRAKPHKKKTSRSRR